MSFLYKQFKNTTNNLHANSPSLHHYGCSTGQEIPRLFENQKGDDNYKTLHTKLWSQYTLYQYTNTGVCVADYYAQNNPPLTLIMSLTKTIQSPLQSYFFQTLTFTLSFKVSKVVPPFQVF